MLTIFGETGGKQKGIFPVEGDISFSEKKSKISLEGKDSEIALWIGHPLVPFQISIPSVVRSYDAGAITLPDIRFSLSGSLEVNSLDLNARLAELKRDFDKGIASNKKLFEEALAKIKHDSGNDASIGKATGRFLTPIIGSFGPYKLYDPNVTRVEGVVDIVGILRPELGGMLHSVSSEMKSVVFSFDTSVGRVNSLILDELANQNVDVGYGINMNALLHLADDLGITGITPMLRFVNLMGWRAAFGVGKVWPLISTGNDLVTGKDSWAYGRSLLMSGERYDYYGEGEYSDEIPCSGPGDFSGHVTSRKGREDRIGVTVVPPLSLSRYDISPSKIAEGWNSHATRSKKCNVHRTWYLERGTTIDVNELDIKGVRTDGRVSSYIVAR